MFHTKQLSLFFGEQRATIVIMLVSITNVEFTCTCRWRLVYLSRLFDVLGQLDDLIVVFVQRVSIVSGIALYLLLTILL